MFKVVHLLPIEWIELYILISHWFWAYFGLFLGLKDQSMNVKCISYFKNRNSPFWGSFHAKSFLFKMISVADINWRMWALCMFLIEKFLLIFNVSCLFVLINHSLLVSLEALTSFEKILHSKQIHTIYNIQYVTYHIMCTILYLAYEISHIIYWESKRNWPLFQIFVTTFG